MQRYIIVVALGVGAILTGLASAAGSQPVQQPPTVTDGYTISGDSLRGLESRDTSKDFSLFFLEPSPNAINLRNGSNNFEVTSKSKDSGLPDIINQIDVGGVDASNQNLFPSMSGDTDQGVKLRYRITE